MKKQLLTLSVRVGAVSSTIINKELVDFLHEWRTEQKKFTPAQLKTLMKAGQQVLGTIGSSHKSVKDKDEHSFRGMVDNTNVFIQLSYVRVDR